MSIGRVIAILHYNSDERKRCQTPLLSLTILDGKFSYQILNNFMVGLLSKLVCKFSYLMIIWLVYRIDSTANFHTSWQLMIIWSVYHFDSPQIFIPHDFIWSVYHFESLQIFIPHDFGRWSCSKSGCKFFDSISKNNHTDAPWLIQCKQIEKTKNMSHLSPLRVSFVTAKEDSKQIHPLN